MSSTSAVSAIPEPAATALRPAGRALFAAGLAALGAMNLVFADGVQGLEPLPAWLPGRPAWAYVTGILLIAASAALLAGARARAGAQTLGVLLALWIVLLHAPALAARPGDGGAWTTAFETLALCGAAWTLVGLLGAGGDAPASRSDRTVTIGRWLFAFSIPAFGVLHFLFRAYVASVVPAWIPGPVFWTYATGVAHVAAGVAIMAGVWPRAAAALLGAMFGSWVLIVHLPRVAAHPAARAEWTSLFVAVAMCGASWVIAAGVDGPRRARG